MIMTDKKEEILELLNDLPISFQEEILKLLREVKAKKDNADFLRHLDKILIQDSEVLRRLAE